MNKQFEEYYQLFKANDVDTIRAAQYDTIMSDPDFTELRERMTRWYFTLTASVPKMGEKMAKSLVVSVLRWELLTDEEKKRASQIGTAHNMLAPKWDR